LLSFPSFLLRNSSGSRRVKNQRERDFTQASRVFRTRLLLSSPFSSFPSTHHDAQLSSPNFAGQSVQRRCRSQVSSVSTFFAFSLAWKLEGDEHHLHRNEAHLLLLPFPSLPPFPPPSSFPPSPRRLSRFMALTDLVTEASHPGFAVDETTETKVTEMVLKLMEDTNGEVKNAGVKA